MTSHLNEEQQQILADLKENMSDGLDTLDEECDCADSCLYEVEGPEGDSLIQDILERSAYAGESEENEQLVMETLEKMDEKSI